MGVCPILVRVAVAEPGFPVGGVVDSRGSNVSKILYVKTKEFGPLGGVRRARPLDPPMGSLLYTCTTAATAAV